MAEVSSTIRPWNRVKLNPLGDAICALKTVCQHPEVTIHSLRWLTKFWGGVHSKCGNELGKSSFVKEIGSRESSSESPGLVERRGGMMFISQKSTSNEWHKVGNK